MQLLRLACCACRRGWRWCWSHFRAGSCSSLTLRGARVADHSLVGIVGQHKAAALGAVGACQGSAGAQGGLQSAVLAGCVDHPAGAADIGLCGGCVAIADQSLCWWGCGCLCDALLRGRCGANWHRSASCRDWSCSCRCRCSWWGCGSSCGGSCGCWSPCRTQSRSVTDLIPSLARNARHAIVWWTHLEETEGLGNRLRSSHADGTPILQLKARCWAERPGPHLLWWLVPWSLLHQHPEQLMGWSALVQAWWQVCSALWSRAPVW